MGDCPVAWRSIIMPRFSCLHKILTPAQRTLIKKCSFNCLPVGGAVRTLSCAHCYITLRLVTTGQASVKDTG